MKGRVKYLFGVAVLAANLAFWPVKSFGLQTDLLFSTTNLPVVGLWELGLGQPAQRFTTDNENLLLERIDVALTYFSVSPGVNGSSYGLQALILPDVNGRPAPPANSLSVFGGAGNVQPVGQTTSLLGNIQLSANTSYWLFFQIYSLGRLGVTMGLPIGTASSGGEGPWIQSTQDYTGGYYIPDMYPDYWGLGMTTYSSTPLLIQMWSIPEPGAWQFVLLALAACSARKVRSSLS